MRQRLVSTFSAVALLAAGHAARAQIAEPNAAGVAMGHLHYFVPDLEAGKAFWVALGGTPGSFAAGEAVHFPGLTVLLSAAETTATNDGTVIDHVAFRIESFAALAAAGFEPERYDEFPGIGIVYTPEGAKVELFEDGVATNVGFELDAGREDAAAERHNRPLTVPIASHHLHFYVPEAEVETARDWYVAHFGATPGTRWRYAAADLPGMNLNFSAAPAPRAPTGGRPLDHIGFEIENLEAFCRELEANGVELDEPYRRLPSGFALAVLTDPWGTRIELTQGLRGR